MNRGRWLLFAVTAIATVAAVIMWLYPRHEPTDHDQVERDVEVVEVSAPAQRGRPIPEATPTQKIAVDEVRSADVTTAYRPSSAAIERIVTDFTENSSPPPAGYRGQKQLNATFLEEKVSDRSSRMTRDLRNIILAVPALDNPLISQGVECRETLCRVVGAFDTRSSSSELSDAMRKVQRLDQGQLVKMGITSQPVMGFRGSNFMAFFDIGNPER